MKLQNLDFQRFRSSNLERSINIVNISFTKPSLSVLCLILIKMSKLMEHRDLPPLIHLFNISVIRCSVPGQVDRPLLAGVGGSAASVCVIIVATHFWIITSLTLIGIIKTLNSDQDYY